MTDSPRLDDASVAWLQEQARRCKDRCFDDADPVETARRALTLAARTPAWTELHRSILVGLLANGTPTDEAAAVFEALVELDALVDACPQVVGVDAPAILLTRAVWTSGSLLLTLHAADPNPDKLTTMRVVGGEPRLWFMTGIAGATTDVSQHSMLVLVPAVDGDLEFVPGSY